MKLIDSKATLDVQVQAHALLARKLDHGTPALVAADRRVWTTHLFDDLGRWVNAAWDVPRRDFLTPAGEPDILGWARAVRGLEPGRISVRPFDSAQMAVRLWPRQYMTDFLDIRSPLMRQQACRAEFSPAARSRRSFSSIAASVRWTSSGPGCSGAA